MRSIELGELSADIRPDLSKNNPRNSEGAFFTLKNGDILFAYSKFKGKSNADFASADICLLRSKDNGRSFGEEKTIMTCESEKAVNIMSLSFLEMKNGDVGLFYLVRQTICGCISGDLQMVEKTGAREYSVCRRTATMWSIMTGCVGFCQEES